MENNLVIKDIIMHVLKDKGGPRVLYSNSSISASDDEKFEFINKVIISFKKKSPTIGDFEKNESDNSFESKFKKYLDDKDLITFSKNAMLILEDEINKTTAKGGAILFAHYILDNNEFFTIVMIDKSPEFDYNTETLTLEKLEILNTSDLSRANNIDITKYLMNDIGYLEFIKGKREISDFFKRFIGNTDTISAKSNIKNLEFAIDKFLDSQGYSDNKSSTIRQNVGSYLKKQTKKGNDIVLNSISAIVNSEEPESFIEFVKKNDYKVSGRFKVNKKSDINPFFTKKIEGKGFTLNYDKSLIEQKKIIKASDSSIVIKDVPKKQMEKLFGTSDSKEHNE